MHQQGWAVIKYIDTELKYLFNSSAFSKLLVILPPEKEFHYNLFADF